MKYSQLIGSLTSLFCLSQIVTFSKPAPAAPAPVFRTVVRALNNRTSVPVLLPADVPSSILEMRSGRPGVICIESAADNAYDIVILTENNTRPEHLCSNYANVQFMGSFRASVGAVDIRPNVRLSNGIRAQFWPSQFGGSGDLSTIRWNQNGSSYYISLVPDWENQDPLRQVLIGLAESASSQGNNQLQTDRPSRRSQTARIQNADWQLVIPEIDAYIDVNNITRNADNVIFDVVGNEPQYVRLEGNCRTGRTRLLRMGYFETATTVRFQTSVGRGEPDQFRDPGANERRLLQFACARAGLR